MRVSPCGLIVLPHSNASFRPGMAHKLCTEQGTWFRHPESNLTWSNYTTCVDVEDLEVKRFSFLSFSASVLMDGVHLQMRQAIVSVYITGYSISLIALVASLAILCGFRSVFGAGR